MSNDIIYRQSAINALKALAVPLHLDSACEDIWERDRTIDNAINVMRGLPPAQPDWVPVTKKLPEDYQDVLVWFEYYRYGSYNRMYSTYGIGTYSKRYDSWMVNHESGWKDLRVIAWIPLPKSYSERRQDG